MVEYHNCFERCGIVKLKILLLPLPMYDFKEKCVLVTGGSRGIGRAIAEAFASCGAKVAVVHKSNVEAAETALEILKGCGHIAIQADVSDSESVAAAIEKTTAILGGLDIAINSAGVALDHPIAETQYEDWQMAWRRTIDVNLIGSANVCYCAARYMMAHGGGRIVNISSRGAFQGEPDKPAYGASKAGLNALSQSLAVALAPHNIFVGVIAPGFVDTDLAAEKLAGPSGEEIRLQSPLKRVARAEEVANAALFLASAGAEFTTGTIIDLNGASYLRT